MPGSDPTTPNLTFAVTNRVTITSPSTGADSGGETSYKDYDALGDLLASTNPNGDETTYAYDQVGDQTQMLSPKGQAPQNSPSGEDLEYATTMTYDPAGRLSTSTDGYNAKTNYGYDADGNVTLVQKPKAGVSASNSTPVPQVTTHAYDGRDLPWKTTTGSENDDGDTTGGDDGSGGIDDARTTITEYDGDGNLVRTVNPAGVDENGNAYETYTSPYYTTNTSSATANPNPNLNATIDVYDNNNDLRTSYLPWGCNDTSNQQKPSPSGTVCIPSTSNSAQTGNDTRRFAETFTRDNLGRLTASAEGYDYTNSNAYQVTTRYGYQPDGWIDSETDPTLSDSSLAKSTSDVTSYTYDPAGDQLQWMTKAQDGTAGGSTETRTVNNTYWPSGQLENMSGTGTGAGGSSIHAYSYFYEPAGQQSQIEVGTGGNSDGSPDTETMTYDSDGELHDVNETLTDGATQDGYDTTYSYDQDGNVATRQQDGHLKVDGSYMGGNRAYFTYDHDDRETSNLIVSNTSSQPSRLFTTAYWPSGQPELSTREQIPVGQALPTPNPEPGSSTCPATSPSSGLVDECRYYNDDGSISEDVRSSDTKDQTYTYDTDENRTNSENGQHLYNALDQEVQWTRGGIDEANSGSTVNYLLDGTGGLLRTVDTAGGRAPASQGGGLVTTTTLDCSAATITAAEQSDPSETSTGSSSPCQHDADRVEVSNTASANTSQLAISDPTSNYCYDAFGELVRLTQSSCPTDDADAESFNPLPTPPGQPPENPQTTTIYQYSPFGQQKAVKAPDAASSSQNPSIDTIFYEYDALDRRYEKTEQIGSGSQQPDVYGYIGQSNDISQETTTTPPTPPSTTPDTVLQTYDYSSSGQRLGVYRIDSGQSTGGIYHSYATDADGSVEALENADGTITQNNRYHYTPYGSLEKGKNEGGEDPTSTTTPEQSLGADAETNNYRYEGFYEDSGVDTYDLQARNYLPSQGLYTTQDTFQDALGDQELRDDPLTQDLYAYAGGNPTSNIEYDGHVCQNGQAGEGPVGNCSIRTLNQAQKSLNDHKDTCACENTNTSTSTSGGTTTSTAPPVPAKLNASLNELARFVAGLPSAKNQPQGPQPQTGLTPQQNFAAHCVGNYASVAVVADGGESSCQRQLEGHVLNHGSTLELAGSLALTGVAGILSIFNAAQMGADPVSDTAEATTLKADDALVEDLTQSGAPEGGVDVGSANFAQTTYGEAFSSGGRFAGQSIDDVAGALRSGELSPEDVPIEAINRDGNTLILNTRSAQALERADIPRSEWNVVNVTGDPAAEARLSGQLGRNGLTSSGYPSPTSSGG